MEGSPHAHKTMIVMEGAVRSGKTSVASLSFVLWVMSTFNNKNAAFCGKSIGSARRNIVRPLKQMLEAEADFKVIDHRSQSEGEYLEITHAGHTNLFWIYGGLDESSAAKIQGQTLCGIFYDEAILQPLSFINQGIARLSDDGAKIWITLNPDSPRHTFYTTFLDKRDPADTYSLHLTMIDNPRLSPEKIEWYRNQWAPGSVWFRRYFEGERCAADGMIYGFMSDRIEDGFVVDQLPETFSKFAVGCDYGIANPTVFVLLGLNDGVWYCIKEYVWDSVKDGRQKTNTEYVEDLATKFLIWNGKIVTPYKIMIDPSAAGLIADIKRSSSKYRNIYNVASANNDVLPGIQAVSSMLITGKLKIYNKCTGMIDSMMNYLWDTKAQERGKDQPIKGGSSSADHENDALRYIILELYKSPTPISGPRG